MLLGLDGPEALGQALVRPFAFDGVIFGLFACDRGPF